MGRNNASAKHCGSAFGRHLDRAGPYYRSTTSGVKWKLMLPLVHRIAALISRMFYMCGLTFYMDIKAAFEH
jgi:hypothetical protein